MSDMTGQHAVIYTDGGYLPKHQLGGWGVHGFTFDPIPTKTGTGCKTATITLKGYQPQGYTLKSDEPTITVRSYINGLGVLPKSATNNQAELTGFEKALDWVKTHGIEKNIIKTDSRYVVDGFNQGLSTWANAGWTRADGQPLANQDHWKTIYALKKDLTDRIQLEWVKGHNGDFGNERADQLATKAMKAYQNGIVIDQMKEAPAKGYWKPIKTRSRLLNLPQWYFPSVEATSEVSSDFHVYYCGFAGKPPKDTSIVNTIGKESVETKLAVIYLKDPDPVLETIRQDMIEMAKGRYRGLMVGDLAQIFDPVKYNEVLEFGTATFLKDYSRLRLLSDPATMLVEEITPARLVYKCIDQLNEIEDILKAVVKRQFDGPWTVTDITASIYELKQKAKKSTVQMKQEITQTTRHLDVEVNYRGHQQSKLKRLIRLNVGQDLPDRNTLSAIASHGTQVYAVTWNQSPHAIRYATVITSPEGAGIWNGPYSNITLLN